MTTAPKVSIITVNRNMADVLERTMESVLGQDYPGLEYIVIDGGSTDASREIIAAHASRLAFWISEPDRGLYDAMNKGLAAATGEWVLFMNSGDRFAAPDVVSRVFAAEHERADILYGDHVRHYPAEGIARLVPAESPDILPRRMHCSHQSLFMRREILLGRPFDIDLLAADYEVLLAAYAGGKRFERVDCLIAHTEMGGRSDINRLKSLGQRVAIVRRHGFMTPGLALHYRLLMLRAILADMAKRLLPRALVAQILRRRPIKGLG